MHKMYLVLGDWSDDGHGKHDKILVETNKDVRAVRSAYKASCKKAGFDVGELCSDYEDNLVPDPIMDKLEELNYPGFKDIADEECYLSIDSYTKLWFWFVGLSLKDFKWKVVEDEIPNINGYWGPFNTSFGYGLYY